MYNLRNMNTLYNNNNKMKTTFYNNFKKKETNLNAHTSAANISQNFAIHYIFYLHEIIKNIKNRDSI